MVVTNVFFPEVESTKIPLNARGSLRSTNFYGPMLKFVPVLADKKESLTRYMSP